MTWVFLFPRNVGAWISRKLAFCKLSLLICSIYVTMKILLNIDGQRACKFPARYAFSFWPLHVISLWWKANLKKVLRISGGGILRWGHASTLTQQCLQFQDRSPSTRGSAGMNFSPLPFSLSLDPSLVAEWFSLGWSSTKVLSASL